MGKVCWGFVCTCASVAVSSAESLKALPTFPKMPVTKLQVQLARGRRAYKDSLVLHVDLVKS